jgi:lipopolysaccharide transport system ATP-binding protein
MSNVIVNVENIGKKYIISHEVTRYKTIREELVNLIKRIPTAFKNKNSSKKEEFWALKDINFKIKKGQRVGIIGKNGAGKSTLLKILSRVTCPTTGRIEIYGRVASLLEVGTGFHTELTGRENIYLNGAILGMKRKEIKKKFDEIVAFSGVEKFLDTPVKRYSSGMYVRLAFAIAAHLEPEILIVDEVLAVGDAEFQKKCMGKMSEVSREEGRTVLFVSHNMTAVKNLCNYAIWLENGRIKYQGEVDFIVDTYLKEMTEAGIVNNNWDFENAPGTDKIKVKAAYVKFKGDKLTVNTPFDIATEFWNLEEGFPMNVSMVITDVSGNIIFNIATKSKPLKKGLHKAVFHIPANLMNDGYYEVKNYFVSNAMPHFIHNSAHSFVIEEERDNSGWHGKWVGAVRPTFIENDYIFIGKK